MFGLFKKATNRLGTARNALMAELMLLSMDNELRYSVGKTVVSILVQGSAVKKERIDDIVIMMFNDKPRVIQLNLIAMALMELGISAPIENEDWYFLRNPFLSTQYDDNAIEYIKDHFEKKYGYTINVLDSKMSISEFEEFEEFDEFEGFEEFQKFEEFEEKKNFEHRDSVIGMIANVIDQLLPKEGYERFSSGCITIDEKYQSIGWTSSKNPPHVDYFFGIKDVESLHHLLADDIFGTQTGMHRTMTVDMYCAGVHKLLLENYPSYSKLKYLDSRLA